MQKLSFKKVLFRTILGIVLLFIAGGILANMSFVQTWLAQKLTDSLSESLGTEVRVERVYLRFLNSFEVDGLYIEDLHQDTMLYVSEFRLSVEDLGFRKRKYKLRKISVDGLVAKLKRYEGESQFDFIEILNRLESEKNSEPLELELHVSDFSIHHSQIEYSDALHEFTKDQLLTNLNSSFEKIHYSSQRLGLAQFSIIGFSNLNEFSIEAKNLGKIDSVIKLDHFLIGVNNSFAKISGQMVLVENQKIPDLDFPLLHAKLETADIASFVEFDESYKSLEMRGEMVKRAEQYVSKGFEFRYGGKTRMVLEGRLSDLESDSLSYQLIVHPSRIQVSDLKTFQENFKFSVPSNYYELDLVNIQGDFSGGLKDLSGYLAMSSSKGKFRADLSAYYEDTISELVYNGQFHLDQFDVGFFTGVNSLGTFSADLDLNGQGISPNGFSTEANGEIREFKVKGHSIRSILLDGDLSNEGFVGNIVIDDDKVELEFDGIYEEKSVQKSFGFIADLRKLDLNAFGLYHRDSIAILSSYISANFTGGDLESFRGNLNLESNFLETSDNFYFVNDLYFKAVDSLSQRYTYLESDILNASLIGKYKYKETIQAVEQTLKYYLGIAGEQEPLDSELDFEMDILDPDPITRIFMPELAIGKNAKVEMKLRSKAKMVWARVKVPRIHYNEYSLEDLLMGVSQTEGGLLITEDIKRLYSSEFNIDGFLSKQTIKNEELNYEIMWNPDSILRYETFLAGNIHEEKGTWYHETEPSWFLFRDSLWRIEEGLNQSFVAPKELTIDSLYLYSPSQSIGVSGSLSEDSIKSLDLWFDNAELAFVNAWIKDPMTKLSGKISGKASLYDIYGFPYALSDLDIDSLYLNKEYLGSLLLGTDWKESENAISIFANLERQGINSLHLTGALYPFEKETKLNLRADFDKFKLYVLSNYTSAFLTDLKGFIDGNVEIDVTGKKSSLTGGLELSKVSFLEPITNVRYNIDGVQHVDLSKKGIFFDGMEIRDSQYGTKGSVYGAFTHSNLQKWEMDLNIKADELFVLNTNSSHSEYYYGTIWGTGDLRIHGPFSDLKIEVDAKGEKGSRFSLPLSSSSEVGNNSFISFVSKEDRSGLAIEEGRRSVSKAGLEMDFKVQVDEGTEVELIYDETVGDIIKGKGTGDIQIQISKEGNIEMYGEYQIASGSYLFTLQNLLNKRFEMQRGGTIQWNGDPYDAVLDITTTYKLRTNLKPLGVSDSLRRYWVYVDLNMSKNLSRPAIGFDIRIPDASRNVQQEVTDVISQSDDELNRQVFSLLVMGSFLTPEYANNSINQNYLSQGVTANSTEILSNQLSHWISKLSDDFDIGVNYEEGGQYAPDQVELALSTQLFNDRVSINGNVGVPLNSTETTTSQIVGDVEVEVRVSRDGNFRVKAFNRSTQYEPLDNRYGYKQGVGVVYQASFSNFEELKAILFKKKYAKEEVVPEENEETETSK